MSTEYDPNVEFPPGKVIAWGIVAVALAFGTVAFIVFAA